MHFCRVAGERRKVEKSFRRSSRPSTAALSSCWVLGGSEVHLKNQSNSVDPTFILTPYIGVPVLPLMSWRPTPCPNTRPLHHDSKLT